VWRASSVFKPDGEILTRIKASATEFSTHSRGGEALADAGLRMRSPPADELDREMMMRCIAVSVRSGEEGEYPYGVVICQAGKVLVESTNRVAHEHDVTRHAEVVAISQAQKALGTVNLDDCVIYTSAEPCAYCSYAIRECRIVRVIYALRSPHMGGVSKWAVLPDEDLSKTMPEVFDPPPEIIAGFMAYEVEQALLKWNPLMWGIVKKRGLLVAGPVEKVHVRELDDRHPWRRLTALLRAAVFDRFGRRW
jgi:tRNA(adenine34) deaminase